MFPVKTSEMELGKEMEDRGQNEEISNFDGNEGRWRENESMKGLQDPLEDSKGILFWVSIPSNQRRCVIDAKIVALNTGSSFLRPADASRIALFLLCPSVSASPPCGRMRPRNVVTSCPSLFIGCFDDAY